MSDWKTVQPKTSEDLPPVWDPKVGDVCEGVLTERKPDLGPNKSTLLSIEDEMGNKTLIWSNAVLTDRLSEVEIGAEVRITFLGLVKGKNGREYKNYEVAVRG